MAAGPPAVSAGGDTGQRLESAVDLVGRDREDLKTKAGIAVGPAISPLGHGGGRAETKSDTFERHRWAPAVNMSAQDVGDPGAMVGVKQATARAGVYGKIPRQIFLGFGDVGDWIVDAVYKKRIMVEHDMPTRFGQLAYFVQPKVQGGGGG